MAVRHHYHSEPRKAVVHSWRSNHLALPLVMSGKQ
jgi:hypothetical protein